MAVTFPASPVSVVTVRVTRSFGPLPVIVARTGWAEVSPVVGSVASTLSPTLMLWIAALDPSARRTSAPGTKLLIAHDAALCCGFGAAADTPGRAADAAGREAAAAAGLNAVGSFAAAGLRATPIDGGELGGGWRDGASD